MLVFVASSFARSMTRLEAKQSQIKDQLRTQSHMLEKVYSNFVSV